MNTVVSVKPTRVPANAAAWSFSGRLVLADLLLLGVTLGSGWFAWLNVESPLRALVTLTFLVVGPGAALSRALDIRHPALWLALSIGVSLALDILAATAAVYMGLWYPRRILFVLIGLTLIVLSFGAWNTRRLAASSNALGRPRAGRVRRLIPVPVQGETFSTYLPLDYTRELQVGSEGPDVARLQLALVELHCLAFRDPAGMFGPYTDQAVRRFQAHVGLPPTGHVDVPTALILGQWKEPVP